MKSSRQKIKEHKRRSYFRWFFLIVVVFALINMKYFIANNPVAIGELEIRPQLVGLNRQDVLLISNLKEPVNILNIDRTSLKQKLSSDLRIKNVNLTYAFPLKLVVNIEENAPLVCLVSKYAFFEVDENSQILKVSRGITNPNIPILSGVSVESAFVGDKIQDTTAQNVIEFLKGLDSDSRAAVSDISLKNNIVEVMTMGRRRIILGTPETVAAKASDYNIVMKQIRDQNLSVEYVNLSYDRPFIKIKPVAPQPGIQQNKT